MEMVNIALLDCKDHVKMECIEIKLHLICNYQDGMLQVTDSVKPHEVCYVYHCIPGSNTTIPASQRMISFDQFPLLKHVLLFTDVTSW